MAPIFSREIAAEMTSVAPIGGVKRPIERFTTIITPSWIGLTPMPAPAGPRAPLTGVALGRTGALGAGVVIPESGGRGVERIADEFVRRGVRCGVLLLESRRGA
jgi:hypothetical protein